MGIPKGANTVVYPFEWRPRHTIDADIVTEYELSDSSQISLKDYERTGVTTTIQYAALSDRQYIEVPVIYYKGYRAFDENGKEVTLEEGHNNRIQVMLQGDGKVHTVTLDYHIPAGYTISAWISILTAILLLLYRLCPGCCLLHPSANIPRSQTRN